LTQVSFACDRCHEPVEGLHTSVATAGFYVVDSGAWAKYARPGEHFVCETCIQSMPEYRSDYRLDG
jgi:hypothetical protein